MKVFEADLQSISTYGQSAYLQSPKKEKEGHDAYEKRIWRERMHVDENGYVFIPPMAFKNCLRDAAQYLGLKIPGEGQAKWTKNFKAGIMVTDGLTLDIKRDDVDGLWILVPSNGQTGGKTRVLKCFGQIFHWQGKVKFFILDEKITLDIFSYILEQAGQFIGIGFFRPINGGYWGRFKVNSVVEVGE